jgi:hypothetical protein
LNEQIKTIHQTTPKHGEGSNTDADFDVDLMESHVVDIQGCETVCLALGPYRNLTTLTAATLFLHPNCQVLNHAGKRIYGNEKVDFLSNYSKERFDRFIQFAIQISIKGTRGDAGGSIIHSHAFDTHHAMGAVFLEAGGEVIKPQINCLFWKESLATSNLIREKNLDLASILNKEARLRFLMPIRNPLDCAVSNLKTGHAYRFRGLGKDATMVQVLQAVLEEIHWFASCRESFPNRFFYFIENSISREMLLQLAAFLKLKPDEAWLTRALSVMVVKSNYKHDSDLLAFYRSTVKQQFSRFPALAEQLLDFAQDKHSVASAS